LFIYHSDIKLQYVSKQLRLNSIRLLNLVKHIIEYRAIGADNEKILFLIPLIAVVMSFSSPATADDDDYYEDDDYSYSQPPENYYQPPQPQQQYYNDQRSTKRLGRRGSW